MPCGKPFLSATPCSQAEKEDIEGQGALRDVRGRLADVLGKARAEERQTEKVRAKDRERELQEERRRQRERDRELGWEL
jgi:hypothetical protein